MSTTTKKAPGRPKKAPANTPVETTVKKVESSIKYKEPEPHNFGYTFQAIKGGIVFMLPQSGITIFDENQNRVREIRYCENMGSIFVDEQGEHARRGSIVFRDGNLLVPPNKPQLAEYLRAHPGNKENGGSSFFEIKKPLGGFSETKPRQIEPLFEQKNIPFVSCWRTIGSSAT